MFETFVPTCGCLLLPYLGHAPANFKNVREHRKYTFSVLRIPWGARGDVVPLLKGGPGPISETCLTCLRHCSFEFYLFHWNVSIQACGGVEHCNIVLEPGHLRVASLSNMCSNSHRQQGSIDAARNSVTQVFVFLVVLAFCCSSNQRCPPPSLCSQPHHIVLLSVYSAVPDDIALCVL